MPCILHAQFNVREYENRFSIKPYHFGISLGYNTSGYRVDFNEQFINHDSILVADATNGPGFNLGIISNLRLGKYLDLRFIPSLSFAEKNLNYTYTDNTIGNQNIESIYIDFPFDVKFKSAAYKEMKVYVLGGVKYSYDLASNATARNAQELVKVRAHDVSLDYGLGFEFYFPYFIFSPEIKLSSGIVNIHAYDPNLQESAVIDKLFSRTVLFSIHLEG
ncbi:MAG: outer membrane beta-barrel protein [Chitinophagales bacterium]